MPARGAAAKRQLLHVMGPDDACLCCLARQHVLEFAVCEVRRLARAPRVAAAGAHAARTRLLPV
jgi:hypothetical protein